MTAAELQTAIDRLGVVRCGSSMVAKCGLCQPDETDVAHYHLSVSPGRFYPLVAFCHCCSIPKPATEEDRQFNRQVIRKVFAEAGVDLDAVYGRMAEDDIRRLWEQVTVVGGVPEADDGIADDDTLHRAYSELLGRLDLSERHRRWLAKRGLDGDDCYRWGYRSTGTGPVLAPKEIDGMPGLSGRRWLLRENALLIPCRDRLGRVGALKQRLMGGGRSRMRLVSGGGAKAKYMIHHPLKSKVGAGTTVWVTEGERKADHLFSFYGGSVVGLPGVGAVGRAIGLCLEAGSAVLAFDADAAGRKATVTVGAALAGKAQVLVARWSEGKGIDDALRMGSRIDVLEWSKVEVEYAMQSPSPPTKRDRRQYQIGQRLSDSDIVPYIRQFGPVLRSGLVASGHTVSRLIREGVIRMTKTDDGQLLEVPNAAGE